MAPVLSRVAPEKFPLDAHLLVVGSLADRCSERAVVAAVALVSVKGTVARNLSPINISRQFGVLAAPTLRGAVGLLDSDLLGSLNASSVLDFTSEGLEGSVDLCHIQTPVCLPRRGVVFVLRVKYNNYSAAWQGINQKKMKKIQIFSYTAEFH